MNRLSPLAALVALGSLGLFAAACGSSVIGGPGDDESECGPAPSPSRCVHHECEGGEWVSVVNIRCDEEEPPPCPESQPSFGSACESLGQQCAYEDFMDCAGGESTIIYTCSEDGWVAYTPRCMPHECPDEMPVDGMDCVGWDYAYFCQYAEVESGCGTTSAVADCEYQVDGSQIWRVNLANECPSCTDLGDADGCEAREDCRWLAAPCTDGPNGVQGCFPAEPCSEDSCPFGSECATVEHDPCWGDICLACSAETTVCLESVTTDD